MKSTFDFRTFWVHVCGDFWVHVCGFWVHVYETVGCMSMKRLGACMWMLGACMRKRLGACMQMLGACMRMLGARLCIFMFPPFLLFGYFPRCGITAAYWLWCGTTAAKGPGPGRLGFGLGGEPGGGGGWPGARAAARLGARESCLLPEMHPTSAYCGPDRSMDMHPASA